MAEESKSATIEIVIALVLVVASFMYIYDYFIDRAQLDVLIAVIIFAGGLVWLFSNVWKKK
ncbi:MAG: hypothetical protein PHD95_04425 [Candidatus ainarchaeum sp.]|nr:hypothetical protein [Candidatus ainarchaeum sp.]